MKKLFNYALLAAALLVGVNVNAENVAKIGLTEYATLQEAIDAAQNGETITLMGKNLVIEPENVNFFKPVDTRVSLDLAGYTLKFGTSAAGGYNFRIVRGTLNVTGPGTIENQRPITDEKDVTKNQCESVFGVFGYWGTVDSAAVYSKLIIGEQVEVKGGKNAICVMEMTAANVLGTAAANLDAFGYRNTLVFVNDKKQTSGIASGAHVEVNGSINAQKYGIKVNGAISRPDAKEGFDTNAPQGDARPTNEYTKWQDYGNLKKYLDCAPYVTVGSTAHVITSATAAEATAIYSSGYGHWLIKGECKGSTGVYIKSGTVVIQDAVIESTSTNAWEEPGKDKGSGIDAGGSAIVIESQDGYPGATEVTITGDSKITAASGYAIESATTSSDTKVNSITIEGGSFTGGDQGGVIFDAKTDTDGKVDVEGGNYDKDDVQNYINAGEGGNVTVIDNGDGTTTFVVGQDKGRPEETDTEKWHKNAAPANQDYLMWTEHPTGVVNIESNATITKEFKMNDGEIRVQNNATFTVEKLVMGADAKITVAPGAILVINGTTGVVAGATGNIVLEATSEFDMGQLLFNPQVASNRRPMATVRFFSKSWGISATEYKNQFFGCPMHAVSNITMNQTGYNAAFQVWRYDHYDMIGTLSSTMDYTKFDIPFGFYVISTNNPENTWVDFNITGNLLGNTAPDNFKMLSGWTSAANSWTGNMNIEAVNGALENLMETKDEHITPYVYTYTYSGHNLIWNAIDDNATIVGPMQPILFANVNGNAFASDVLNYKDLVWDPIKGGPSSAPRMSEAAARLVVRIAATDGTTDRVVLKEADKFAGLKYCAPKYMSNELCVYANANKQYDIFASDNVENTVIGFNCKEAGKYTVSFENAQGENFVLVDLMNNARIEMVEGATYEFMAQANEANDHRFMVVRGAQAPTKMDKVDAKANAVKVISDGQFRIVKNGRAYNAMGAEL